MKKNEKTALIIALSIFGAGILIFLCVMLSVNFDFTKLQASTHVGSSAGNNDSIKAEHVEKVINENGQDIILDLSSADVTVKPSDDGKIHISYDNTEDTYFELNEGAKITLTQRHKDGFTFGLVFYSEENFNVEVSIPEHHDGELLIDGASSDISVSDIELTGKLEINSVSGSITIENCNAESIGTESTSGDVEISTVKTSTIQAGTVSGDIRIAEISENTPLSLETTSGEVYAENVKSENLKTETVSGDVDLRNVTGNKATLSSTSGDVRLDSADFREINYTSVSGSIKGTVSGSAEDYSVYTNSLSGNNSLSSHREHGEKTLDLSSTSGDFDISFKK